MRPREPVAVYPIAISQLNCEAVAGINPRRFLDWLAAHPKIPRARIGRLAIVEASVFLAHLAEISACAGVEPVERAEPDDDEVPETVDGVLARLGLRRK